MERETKMLIVALAEIVRNAKDKEQIYRALMKMASVEGFTLDPFEDGGE